MMLTRRSGSDPRRVDPGAAVVDTAAVRRARSSSMSRPVRRRGIHGPGRRSPSGSVRAGGRGARCRRAGSHPRSRLMVGCDGSRRRGRPGHSILRRRRSARPPAAWRPARQPGRARRCRRIRRPPDRPGAPSTGCPGVEGDTGGPGSAAAPGCSSTTTTDDRAREASRPRARRRRKVLDGDRRQTFGCGIVLRELGQDPPPRPIRAHDAVPPASTASGDSAEHDGIVPGHRARRAPRPPTAAP